MSDNKILKWMVLQFEQGFYKNKSIILNMTVCRYFPATQSFLSVSFFDRPEFSRSHPIMCFKNRIEMASVGKAKGF